MAISAISLAIWTCKDVSWQSYRLRNRCQALIFVTQHAGMIVLMWVFEFSKMFGDTEQARVICPSIDDMVQATGTY